MDIAMPRTSVRLRSFRRWVASAALAAAVAVPATAFAQVVVIANGSPITAYDIEQRTKLIATSTHKAPTRQEVIQDLIDDRIKITKAKSYGFEVPDTEVDQAFANMAKNQHLSPQQFTQVLERAGISPTTIKARVRAELTWTQLVRGRYSASLEIGESEFSKALSERNDSQGDVAGYIYTLYPVMVLVPPGSSAAVMEAKRREAENLRGRFISCNEGLAFSRALRDVALRDKKESKTDSPLKREVRQALYAKKFDVEAKKYLDEIRKSAMIEYK